MAQILTLICIIYIAWLRHLQSVFNVKPSQLELHHVDLRTSQLHFDIHNRNPLNSPSAPLYGLNVLDYGAKGDAETDNTVAFNNALTTAAQNNSGSYVYVPSGQYLFNGNIIIPSGVTLIGTYNLPPSHSFNDKTKGMQWSDLTDGSILGVRNKDKSFITMKESATIKGFSIWYPDQKCDISTNENPIEYAATILTDGSGVGIIDLELINSYFGISASRSSRHYIARIYGGPLKTGIFIDDQHDTGRVENIHWHAKWSCPENSTTIKWLALNGIGFILGDTDWQFMFNTLSYGYAGGYNFISTGGDQSDSPNGNFLGIAADGCTNYSIKIDQTKKWGISITNGEFVARANPRQDVFIDDWATGVIVSETNIGAIHFDNCIFFGQTVQWIAKLHGDSSTTFNNCEFYQWNSTNPVILSDNGIVKIMNSNFHQPNAQIEFQTGTQKAFLVGNSFAGTPDIKVDNGVNFTQSNNL